MNVKTVVAVALVGGAAALTGCASTHGKGDSSAFSQSDSPFSVDTEYVAAVEHYARHYDMQVIWVHPPTRKQVASRD